MPWPLTPGTNWAFQRPSPPGQQAALTSAATFAVGASFPLVIVGLTPPARLVPIVASTSLAFLGLLGGLAARAGGARMLIGAARVVFWGALAMGMTAAVGALFGA